MANFCTACGTQLGEGARFCAACGAPVAAAPPAATPTPPPPPPPVAAAPASPAPVAAPTPPPPAVTQPATTGERVLAIIPNASMKAGLMKRATYTLVLTDRRIIFAEATAAMLKQAVSDARDSAKADGKGFFGQWGAQMGAYSAMAESYLAMSPEHALAQNPGNFAIDRAQIQSCKLKSGTTDYEDNRATPDRLVIKSAAGKHSLDLGSGKGQAKQALVAAAMI